MTTRELRADTPALHEDVYLNVGAHGPSPRCVVEAADEFVQSHEYGTGARNDPSDVAFDACDRARERVADFVPRSLPGPNAVRVAVHTVTTTAEVGGLLDALEPEWN